MNEYTAEAARHPRPGVRDGLQTTRAGRRIRLTLAALAVLPAAPAAAQAPLGMPFIGDNSLVFYMTELTVDGFGQERSALSGGQYGRQLGSPRAPGRFSFSVLAAARAKVGPSDGVLDVGVTVAWTRRMEEIDGRLSVTAAAGAGAHLWGSDDPDAGLVRASLPLTMGLAWDVRIGGATFSPFIAPAMAYYSARHEVGGMRLLDDTGWDGRLTAGVSLRLSELVLSTSTVRGEAGMPHRNRWVFTAGISF